MLKTVATTIGLLFVTFVLAHWMSAGQDNIIEGPPETPDVVFSQQP